MSRPELKQLPRVEEFFEEGKLDKALEILSDLNQFEELNLKQKNHFQFLKGLILIYQNKSEQLIELGEQIFKEGQMHNDNLKLFDGLFFILIGLGLANKFDESLKKIEKAEELLSLITNVSKDLLFQRKIRLNLLRGRINLYIGNTDLAEKYLEWTIDSQKELGNTFEIIWAHLLIAQIMFQVKARFDLAMEHAKKAMSIAKKIKFNHFWIGFCHTSFGAIYSSIYEYEKAFKHSMKSLAIFKEINNNWYIAIVLNNLGLIHCDKGDYDLALKYLEEALILWEQYPFRVEYCLDSLIFVALEKGDIDLAQKYFHRLQNIYNKKKEPHLEILYNYNKASILKRSSRIRDKAKAEKLFKQITETETLFFDFKVYSYVHLCDLFLSEFRINKNSEILDEIDNIIAQLLTIAEKAHSYLVFCETYILQAKLALIDLDVKAARRFLSKAQKIAESYGIKRLAMKISYEHDELLKQLEMWEILKESNASLAERIELSGLNKQIERMLRKRVVSLPKLEAEQPVLLTIMSKEGNIILSNPFTADITIDSTYFGEFLASCNTFCDQIFSETFDRVKFGQNTVLITTIDSFSICYMFQGQSYSARQKLNHFSEAIRKDSEIMKTLEEAKNKNIEIKISETASFEDLIYKSFLSDPKQFQMPFKAYEGDGPFVFVSYSHSDRLQVYPIIDYLNKTGRNIWYDEGIPVSEDWIKSIAENLERCSAFLVFITPHIIDSEYVRKEISFALKKKKSFFSVYLRETELPIELEFEMGNIQFMKKYLIPESEFYTKLNRMLDPILK